MKQTKVNPSSPLSEVLSLFRDNLCAMRQHYRTEKNSGQNLGHNVLLEMAITDVSKALEAAIEGRPWKPGY